MRDQVRTPTKYVYKWAHHMEACTSTEWNNYGGFAWALSYSRLESWWNNGNPATDTGVFTSTTYSTTYPVGTLLRARSYYNFSGTAYDFNPIEFYTCVLTGVEVDGLYSAVSHKGDFLGLSWYPYQSLPTFIIPPFGGEPPQTEWMDYSSQMKSNKWSQWDTVPATNDSLVSTQQLGSWTLPPYTDIPDLSQYATRSHVGYTLIDVRAIVRWQQRACTNAVFDARYQ
jgi:hypothetical protein